MHRAANNRQAWMSSGSKSGKSARISVMLTLAASISKISLTRIRLEIRVMQQREIILSNRYFWSEFLRDYS